MLGVLHWTSGHSKTLLSPRGLRAKTLALPVEPKTIATINFKGGVGKTTATWCLANVAAGTMNHPTLLFDLDAQMSLTQSVALKPETGNLTPLGEWYESAIQKKRTLFHALEEYTNPKRGTFFDFPIRYDFIYHVDGKNLDFAGLGLTVNEHPMAMLRARLPGVRRASDLVHTKTGDRVTIGGSVICRQFGPGIRSRRFSGGPSQLLLYVSVSCNPRFL